jgi:hypothetical protein
MQNWGETMDINTFKDDPNFFHCDIQQCWMRKTACIERQERAKTYKANSKFGRFVAEDLQLEKCRYCEQGLAIRIEETHPLKQGLVIKTEQEEQKMTEKTKISLERVCCYCGQPFTLKDPHATRRKHCYRQDCLEWHEIEKSNANAKQRQGRSQFLINSFVKSLTLGHKERDTEEIGLTVASDGVILYTDGWTLKENEIDEFARTLRQMLSKQDKAND